MKLIKKMKRVQVNQIQNICKTYILKKKVMNNQKDKKK